METEDADRRRARRAGDAGGTAARRNAGVPAAKPLLPVRQDGRQGAATSSRLAPGYAQVEAHPRAGSTRTSSTRYGVSDADHRCTRHAGAPAPACAATSRTSASHDARAAGSPRGWWWATCYRLDPMDLHAWFEAFIDGRWYTFDATQAAPRGGRSWSATAATRRTSPFCRTTARCSRWSTCGCRWSGSTAPAPDLGAASAAPRPPRRRHERPAQEARAALAEAPGQLGRLADADARPGLDHDRRRSARQIHRCGAQRERRRVERPAVESARRRPAPAPPGRGRRTAGARPAGRGAHACAPARPSAASARISTPAPWPASRQTRLRHQWSP